MTCQKKRIKKNKYCIGDLQLEAVFLDRTITPRTDNQIDLDETFSNNTTRWVGVQSINGVDIFDDTNLVGTATHLIVARYESDIFEKRWILLKTKYFKVLRRTNVGEGDSWIEYLCVERGLTTQKVNRA